MSDHTKLATARVADFLSERGWAGEFVADVLAKNPQHVKINGAHAIELVAATLRAAPEAEALRIAMTTLEQIASTPRNKGARMSAKATLLFLQTQLAARPQEATDA